MEKNDTKTTSNDLELLENKNFLGEHLFEEFIVFGLNKDELNNFIENPKEKFTTIINKK